MEKINKLLLFALTVAAVNFTACDKEITNEPLEKSSTTNFMGYPIEKGRLKVETPKDLEFIENSLKSFKTKQIINSTSFKSLEQNNISENLTKSGGQEQYYNDTLVPDTIFAKMLNWEREIQVGEMIYKITPAGTYFCAEEKYDELINYIDKTKNQNSETSKSNLRKSVREPGLRRISDNIYLYDTFKERIDDGGTFSYSGGSTSTTKEPDLLKFKTCKYDAKTLLGKFWQSKFGRNKWETVRFGSKRKVQVKVYNYNYVIKQAFGVSVRFRKKNWVGWSGTRCEEMRLGFEGIIYQDDYTGKPYYTKGLPSEKQQRWTDFKGNISEWPRLENVGVKYNKNGNHNDLCISYYDDSPKLDSYTLKEALKRGRDRALKALRNSGGHFNYNAGYGNAPVGIRLDENFKQTFYVGEITHKFKNRKRIDIELASKFEGSISISNKLSNYIGFWGIKGWDKNIKLGTSYNIEKVSIYGCARYKNEWKGVKIMKE